MWARELALRSGLNVPNTAAEHYYLITDTIDGLGPDTPIFEDPAAHGYYREEGGGMMVGLFEPRAAAWHPEGVPAGSSFTKIQPDWDRMAPVPGDRDGAGAGDAGGRRPHVLLRTRVVHARPVADRRRGAGHARLLRRGRHELRRRAVRRRPGPGRRAVDRRRQARRRRDRLRHRPLPRLPGRGVLPRHAHHRDPRHRLRRAHARQAAALRPRGQALARPRPAGRQRRLPARGLRAGRAPTGSPGRARRRRRRRRGVAPTGSSVGGRAPRRPRAGRADGHVVHVEVPRHRRRRGARARPRLGGSRRRREPSGSPTPSGSTTPASCRPT